MTSPAEHIAAVFGEGKDLYGILEVERSASAAEVKKAYYKAALNCHPDKCPGDETAHGRFQALSMVHQVLSDPENRQLYDETGEIEGGTGRLDKENSDTWEAYWRELFPRVTTADIESFEATYKGSEEEAGDVVKAYEAAEGNMAQVIDSVMLCTEEDEPRFRKIIEAAIADGRTERFDAFKPQKRKKGGAGGADASKGKRKSKADREAAEAEELLAVFKAKEKSRGGGGSGGGDDGVLGTLAARRAGQFDDMMAGIEARYGGGGGAKGASGGKKSRGGKVKAAPESPDIDDAEFERIRAGLGGGGGKKPAGKKGRA